MKPEQILRKQLHLGVNLLDNRPWLLIRMLHCATKCCRRWSTSCATQRCRSWSETVCYFYSLCVCFNKIPLYLLLCVLFHWLFCGRINEASCMSAYTYIVSDTHKWQSPALLNGRSSKLETKLSVLSSWSMHSCVQSHMTCWTWSWSCSAFKCMTSVMLPRRRCTSAFLQEMSVSSHAENNSYIGDNVFVFCFFHHKNEIGQNKQHSSAQDAKHLQMIWYYRHHNR